MVPPRWDWVVAIISIYPIYTIIESLVQYLQHSGYPTFNFIIPMIEKRRELFAILYASLWTPLRPVLLPLYWGLLLKFLLKPGFLRPEIRVRGPSVTVTLLGVGLGVKWIRDDCSGMWNEAYGLGSFGKGDCGEILFVGGCMLVMILGSWFGWNWDGEFVDCVIDERNLRREEEGIEQAANEGEKIEGGKEDLI